MLAPRRATPRRVHQDALRCAGALLRCDAPLQRSAAAALQLLHAKAQRRPPRPPSPPQRGGRTRRPHASGGAGAAAAAAAGGAQRAGLAAAGAGRVSGARVYLTTWQSSQFQPARRPAGSPAPPPAVPLALLARPRGAAHDPHLPSLATCTLIAHRPSPVTCHPSPAARHPVPTRPRTCRPPRLISRSQRRRARRSTWAS